MPEYTFKVVGKVSGFKPKPKKGDIISLTLKISEYDEFKARHPGLERYIDSAPAVSFDGRHFGSLDAQTSDGFKEVLARIGEQHPHSPLAERYRKNKSVKEVKTQQIVANHLGNKKKK